jgi:hypothetical protein
MTAPAISIQPVFLPPAIEGQALTLVYIGTAPSSDPSLVVEINWGDNSGTSAAIPVTVDSSGNFSVNLTHIYTEEGAYFPLVAFADNNNNHLNDTPKIDVGDAPLTNVVATGGGGTGTEGITAISAPTVSFDDTNLSATTADYTATINWGDGNTTVVGSASFTANGGHGFTFTGPTHIYEVGGTYTINVTIQDIGGAPPITANNAVATIADPPLTITQTTGGGGAGTEGITAISAPTVSFTDGNANAALSDFTATIDWGDGTSTTGASAGTFSFNGGIFTFTPSTTHTYGEDGNYIITETIQDVGGASPISAIATANVADATLTKGSAPNIVATEGTPISAGTTIATFTDGNPLAKAGDFTATIDWGDGTSSPGTVAVDPHGGFDVNVTGSGHTYSHEGTFTPTVTIKDTGGTLPTGATLPEAGAVVMVADADVLTKQGVTATTDPQTFLTTVQASFSDSYTGNVKGDFTATVDWGDGTSVKPDITTETVTETSSGVFEVNGTHAYAAAGKYTVTVTLTDDDGNASAIAQTTASTLSITGIVPSQPPSLNPFAHAAINDFASQTETVTITGLTVVPKGDTAPTLSELLSDPNAHTDHGHFTHGAYVFTGSAAAVTHDLEALKFYSSGFSTQLSVSVTDMADVTVTGSTTILGIAHGGDHQV